MRLKRTQNDFRVTEVIDEDGLFSEGPYSLYRVTKRGVTTFEAADVLAKAAGVPREQVAYAGLKDKDGVTSQIMSVEGGRPVSLREDGMVIRPVSRAARPIESTDSRGNSFEIVMRDLSGDDMRRIRVNLAELKDGAVPNYFDDQRFGCLRHGQGFIVRHLLKGDVENALRSLLAAPSPYGNEKTEQFKAYIQKHWGQWEKLHGYCRARRGASVFAHLVEHPEDFAGALERGISNRERIEHLVTHHVSPVYVLKLDNRGFFFTRLHQPEISTVTPLSSSSLSFSSSSRASRKLAQTVGIPASSSGGRS